MTAPVATKDMVTRAQVEDFLFHEAALLDEWRLDAWQELLADDACYYVPSNDQPQSDHRRALFLWLSAGTPPCASLRPATCPPHTPPPASTVE